MNLWVSALDELNDYYYRYNITHILTLIDEEVEVKVPYGAGHTRLNMWDVESDHSPFYLGDEVANSGIPTREHVQEIINYANSIDEKNDRVLVHCWAGISRSTAAALIIMYILYNKDINRAVERLLEIRPAAAPNKLLCKYADEILNNNQPVLLRAALDIEARYMNNKGYADDE